MLFAVIPNNNRMYAESNILHSLAATRTREIVNSRIPHTSCEVHGQRYLIWGYDDPQAVDCVYSTVGSALRNIVRMHS